ncbi:hypothetical protein [Fluviicola sp.]|uniref:hypothetical protein n=1 Tax=Fluviicola sp. TaxID=1917219 RepID=UPI00261B5D76|nr:hypothetical protein [Fluviicola sp.]
MQLIKTDLSAAKMSISLDGIQHLPETLDLKSSLAQEELAKLLSALHEAFVQQDLTKVTALYSYVALFSETQQQEIRKETVREFHQFLGLQKNDVELSAMYLHAGFANMINQLNDVDLTNAQFKLFERYFLDTNDRTGKRIAGIQRNLPLNSDQKKLVADYLEQLKSENEKVEKKDNTKTIILVIITVSLILIRFALRMSR